MTGLTPKGVQLKRKKGWRKPEAAVVVSRPSKWGNPFVIVRVECSMGGMCWDVRTDPGDKVWRDHIGSERDARQVAVDLFELHTGPMGSYEWDADDLADLRRELAGRDLACWCALDQPCHRDVLLRVANS